MIPINFVFGYQYSMNEKKNIVKAQIGFYPLVFVSHFKNPPASEISLLFS